MPLRQLTGNETTEVQQAMKLYVNAFPNQDERRSEAAEVQCILDKVLNFSVETNEEGNVTAILATWNLGEQDFIEHLAIDQSIRSKGLGSQVMREYLSKEEWKNRMVMLEVERPDEAQTELLKSGEKTNDEVVRRIRFYEKLGFHLNTHDYIQPPYSEGKKAVKLYLMTYPRPIKDDAEFESMRKNLHQKVYGLSKPLMHLE